MRLSEQSHLQLPVQYCTVPYCAMFIVSVCKQRGVTGTRSLSLYK